MGHGITDWDDLHTLTGNLNIDQLMWGIGDILLSQLASSTRMALTNITVQSVGNHSVM